VSGFLFYRREGLFDELTILRKNLQKKLWMDCGWNSGVLLDFLRGVSGKTVDGCGVFVVRSW
jgi:hypothetical protein